MDIFGNFDHFVSNIVQNVSFCGLKKKKKKKIGAKKKFKVVEEQLIFNHFGANLAI